MIDAPCSPVVPAWADVLADASRWDPPDGATVAVVPHPDDEAVMFGGLLAHLVARGSDVRVIAVTDGGSAYPDLVPSEVLEERRRGEQSQAMNAIGIRSDAVVRLGIRDGSVAAHEDIVTDAIVRLAGEHRIAMIVAPWEFDHHTDHEACGRAALTAAERIGGETVVASGLFWSLLRERPRSGIRLAALHLDASELSQKADAIECHRSQVEPLMAERPVLSSADLAVTRWPREHYVVRRVR